MPEYSENSMNKPLPGPPPVNRASQLRKSISSQALPLSPKSTSSRSRDSDRAERTHAGSRRALDLDNRGSRELRHRSSTSTVSRTTTSSLVTSTSGAGTIVGISKDVSANRTVGSGQNGIVQDSNRTQPGRTPLALISTRTSQNISARDSKSVAQPGQENVTPTKTQDTDRATEHMYPSLPISSDKSETQDPTPVLPQLRKLQRQIQSLRAENDDLRAVKITHIATIDSLRSQLRCKEAEQARLVDMLCAEAAAREDQTAHMREAVAALKEEKWALLGRVAELELQQAPSHVEDSCYAGSVHASVPPSHRGSELSRGSHAGGYDTPGSLYSTGGQGGPARSLNHTAISSVATASVRSFVRRRASVAESDVTGASLAEEELDVLSDQLVAHHEQHSKEQRAMAAQLTVLEDDLMAARQQRDRAERRSRDLEVRLAAQMTLVHHHAPAPAAPPIPDLPLLTYSKVGLVWFDTVASWFKYWGLFEFISQPDESLFAGTDPDREGRRLRAVVLLKRAIDDEILDDIMYLQNQKFISAPTAAKSLPQNIPPEIESPYFLFHTAAVLKRTVPNSLTDFGWLDRINDDDFEGIEGFASLVNILNRRHGQLYGTSADHYDALVPRIQESMSRRFPDLEKSLLDPASTPRKWWHLALWMSRMVKGRQGRIAGVDES